MLPQPKLLEKLENTLLSLRGCLKRSKIGNKTLSIPLNPPSKGLLTVISPFFKGD